MIDLNNCFRIGVITSPHGVRGEVKVYPTTDDVSRFDDLKECYLLDKKEAKPVHITDVKYFKNLVILKIKEIPDRNAAELLRNAGLYVDRENAIELSEGEFFIADLIGLDVYTDEDKKLGSLYDVLKTGANDVYVIKTDEGKEILIPVIEDCIKKVDLEAKRVTVHLLKGLLED